MDLEVVERSGVAVVRLAGKLAAGVGDRQLHDLIDELLAENRKRILLDLTEVSGIDSSGVGELVAALRVTRELGGELKIFRVRGHVQRVLHLTQALPLFEVFDDEDAAIAAFDGGAPKEGSSCRTP